MSSHRHARLTYARRLETVKALTEEGLSPSDAVATYGVTPPKVRKWLGRYLAGGDAAMVDTSSRPKRSPKSVYAGKALRIVELSKRRMIQSRVARSVGVSESTVGWVLSRAGLSKLSALDLIEPVVCYEHGTRSNCCTSTPRSRATS